MPHASGLDAIKEVRAIYNVTNFKIKKEGKRQLLMPKFVMFSAHVRKGFENYLKDQGVDFIIEKPPKTEEIFDLIVGIAQDARRKQEV